MVKARAVGVVPSGPTSDSEINLAITSSNPSSLQFSLEENAASHRGGIIVMDVPEEPTVEILLVQWRFF